MRRGRPPALQAPQPDGRAAVARLGACHARHVCVHGGAASPASAARLGWLPPCTCSGPPTGVFQVLRRGFLAASCTTSQTGVQDVATSGGQHSPVHYHPKHSPTPTWSCSTMQAAARHHLWQKAAHLYNTSCAGMHAMPRRHASGASTAQQPGDDQEHSRAGLQAV